jgi:hypothetical protein
MQDVLRSLTQHSAEVSVILLVAVLGLGLLSIRTALRLRKLQGKWSELLQGARGDNLETILYDHVREKMRLENDMNQAVMRIEDLETKMSSAKRHWGLVRYDAFEDVGGSQSFALAMYDEQGNGAVLSGIVGRSDERVYCKPLVNGRSERNLSQEEQRAIRDAKSAAPKSIVSP